MKKEKMNREEKRELRRKRRVRNQILSFVLVLLLVVAGGLGAYFGIKYLVQNIKEQAKAPAVQNVISENEVEETVSAGVIATPDVDEIEELLSDEGSQSEDESSEARKYVDSLTTEQKVASLFVVTPESITGANVATQALDGTKNALEKYAVGGIIYSSSNVENTDQFNEMLVNTKNYYNELYGIDAWTFVKEEGAQSTIAGTKTGVVVLDDAASIGNTGDNGNAYANYITMGSYLKDYHIDVNLGLVCSVKEDENSYIGNRAFSTDADIAASMISKAVDGLTEQGIIVCLNAFPGEGSLKSDPADGKAVSERTVEEMKACEYVPFQSGIENGAKFVMTSHMYNSALTGDEIPCSLSSAVVNDILKNELGFTGVVITDDMSKKSITDNYSPADAAILAINAGNDMILNPANFEESYNAVLEAVNDGTISAERLDDALMRIYTVRFEK